MAKTKYKPGRRSGAKANYARGARGRSPDLSEAIRTWCMFHKKDEPRELIDVNIPWPAAWGYAGAATTVYYNSDKWEPDGEFTKFYHDHGGGIGLWHPTGLFSWLGGTPQAPLGRLPTAVTVLGFSLGVDMKRHDTGQRRHATPARGSFLVGVKEHKARSGRMIDARLWIVEPSQGVTAFITGPGLRIEARGIVG